MNPVVAVAHYPEGAGHATRMLAVAQALERAGADVEIAGGGPGAKFVELNGYDQFTPADVEYIDDYQDGGSLFQVLTHSVPSSAKRVVDYVRWLRDVDPTALVTDDMFAAMAAPMTGTPLYVLTHNAPAFYDAAVEESFTWLLTRYQLAACRSFLYPAVWPPCEDDPNDVERIPPVALEGDAARDVGDILLVPSHYSRGFDELAEVLRVEGHDVTLVGDEDWEPVPALLPLLQAADVVVCSGYSTIMEAAVAGTPCIVYPFTDEQHGVAQVIEWNGVSGFQVEYSHAHVSHAVQHPPEPPRYENGSDVAAERILADIEADPRTRRAANTV